MTHKTLTYILLLVPCVFGDCPWCRGLLCLFACLLVCLFVSSFACVWKFAWEVDPRFGGGAVLNPSHGLLEV